METARTQHVPNIGRVETEPDSSELNYRLEAMRKFRAVPVWVHIPFTISFRFTIDDVMFRDHGCASRWDFSV